MWLLISFLKFLIHFQQVYRVSYYILGFLNDSEVNDSYFDVGDLFPHVTYFFPFEYTSLIDEYIPLIVEGGKISERIFFDRLPAFLQERYDRLRYLSKAVFLALLQRIEIIVGMFQTRFAGSFYGVDNVVREIVPLKIIETFF